MVPCAAPLEGVGPAGGWRTSRLVSVGVCIGWLSGLSDNNLHLRYILSARGQSQLKEELFHQDMKIFSTAQVTNLPPRLLL
jgi:hypothetical protein